MGFCKPGDPCWGTLEQTDFGQVNLAKFLEYGSEAKTILAACGIDIDTLNPSICAQVNNCITGNTHHSLTACTIYADVIHPCTTGTTFTSDVVVGGNVKTINFQMTSGATVGYTLTSDASGNASWQASSGGGGGTFTGNTSGDCIQELWVSTISGCSPVIIGPSVGIGTTYPNKPLSVVGGISGTSTLNINGNSYLDGTLSVGLDGAAPSAPIEVKDYIKFHPTYGNTFYGQLSGQYAAEGGTTQYNTGIGKWALGAFNAYGELDGAVYNVAVGGLSQAYRTTGDYNTSVGQASMQSHTTSSWNTSVGYQAGMGVVFEEVGGNNYNTYIGANSGWYQTGQSGEDTYNTAVGYSSMYTSLGFYTTSIGALSQGSFLAPAGCNACTSVGYKTLYNAGTGGVGAEYNIAIGYQAGDSITLGAHNICIGNDVDPPSATGDYQMNIGGIIHGRDIDGSSSINTIGIGTSTPNEKLTVVGAISATSQIYFSEIDGGSF